jgi:hypothetical protein
MAWSACPSSSQISICNLPPNSAGRGADTARTAHIAPAVERAVGERQGCYNHRMENRLKDLMACIDDWPPAVQEEAIASLEAIAGYVSLHEPSHNDPGKEAD